METPLAKQRIESLDLLKGLIMVIMALDHVRDYFHADANFFDPADPEKSTLFLFFTRWITHFCAPTFSFLAGVSAFLVGRRKSKSELSTFLLQRGLWLVFIELTVVNFAWYFDLEFRTISLLVIWCLGISMVALAGIIHLSRTGILIFSCALIFGHNLMDTLPFQGTFWALLHQQAFVNLTEHTSLLIGYPLIPWIAVMSLGYYFGAFYDRSVPQQKRTTLFSLIGISALIVFIVLRWTNIYGDPAPYVRYDTISQNVISFFNPSKYPPSLLYVLMTLGGSLLFLANSENLRGKAVEFFSIFGRVPFFYYILHLFLIHILAMVAAELSGHGWQTLILSTWIGFDPKVRGYGFDLWVVYVMWGVVIAILYPLCKWFDRYKKIEKEKWWLSYL